MLNHYSNNIAGCVNFPIHDLRFVDTTDEGITVRLVVLAMESLHSDKNNGKKNTQPPSFLQCRGGLNLFPYENIFLGDDVTNLYNAPVDATEDQLLRETEEFLELKKLYFRVNKKGALAPFSRGVLAALTIGSTTWSGVDATTRKTWKCKESDLNEDGLALLGTLRKIYPGHSIRLLTFLDIKD